MTCKLYKPWSVFMLTWKNIIALLLVFALEKPLFMLYNHTDDGTDIFTLADVLDVVCHGISIDLSLACYACSVPLILMMLTCVWRTMPIIRVLKVYYLIVALLLAIVFVSDTALYKFWGFKLDSTALAYLSYPEAILANVSIVYALAGFASIAIVVFLIYKALIAYTPAILHIKSQLPNALTFLIVFMVHVALLVLGIRGGVGESTMNLSHAYYSDKTFLNHSAVNPLFSIVSSLSKNEDFASQFQFLETAEADSIYTHLYTHNGAGPEAETDSIQCVFKQQPDHIVLILWESGGDYPVMSATTCPATKEMAKEGVYFSHCYANSFRTDRGIVSTLNGWLGMPNASMMKVPSACRKLASIARTLSAHGYESQFMYGGDINFTNMKGYFYESGYNSVMGDEAFTLAEQQECEWGVSDEKLFRRATESVLAYGSQSAAPKSFTTILTLNTHEPWDAPNTQGRTMTDEARKLACYEYTDSCIGNFISHLKSSPMWDKTLVILIADHGAAITSHQTPTDPRIAHIPCIWIGGVVSPGIVIDKVMNQSDLAATLLSQLGYSHADFPFSRNILSNAYTRQVAFQSCSNQFTLIDETGLITYDCASETCFDELGASVPIADKAQKTLHLKGILQSLYSKIK